MVNESDYERHELLRQIDQVRGGTSREEYLRHLMEDLDRGREMPRWYRDPYSGQPPPSGIGRREFDEFRHEMRSILKDLIDYVVPGEEQEVREAEPSQGRFRKAVSSRFKQKKAQEEAPQEEEDPEPSAENEKEKEGQKPSRLRIYYGKPGLPGSRVEEVIPTPRAPQPETKNGNENENGKDEDSTEQEAPGTNPQLDRLAQLMEQMLAHQQGGLPEKEAEGEEGPEVEPAETKPRPKRRRGNRRSYRRPGRRAEYEEMEEGDEDWEHEPFEDPDWYDPLNSVSPYGYPPLPPTGAFGDFHDNMAFAAMDSIQRNLEMLSSKMSRLERQRNLRSPPAPALPPIFEYLEKPVEPEAEPEMEQTAALPQPSPHQLPYPQQQTMLVMGPNGQVMEVPAPAQPSYGQPGHPEYGPAGQLPQGSPGQYPPGQYPPGQFPPGYQGAYQQGQLPAGPTPTSQPYPGQSPARAAEMAEAFKDAAASPQEMQVEEVQYEAASAPPDSGEPESPTAPDGIIMPASMGGGSSEPTPAASAAEDEMPADGIVMPGGMSKPEAEPASPPPEKLPEAEPGEVIQPGEDEPTKSDEFPSDGIIMPGGSEEPPAQATPPQEEMPDDGIIMPQGMDHKSSNHGAYMNSNSRTPHQPPHYQPPVDLNAPLTPYDPLTTPEDELDGFIAALRSSGEPFELPEGQPVPPPLPSARVTRRVLQSTPKQNRPLRSAPTRVMEAKVEEIDPYPLPEEESEEQLEAFMAQVTAQENASQYQLPEPDYEQELPQACQPEEQGLEDELIVPPSEDEEADLPPWKTQFDLLWVGAFIMFGVGDVLSTWWAISNGAIEANPFLHNIVHGNFMVFVLIKIILMMVAFLYSYVILMENGHDARFMPAVFILAGTYLVVNNYMVVRNLQNGTLTAAS